MTRSLSILAIAISLLFAGCRQKEEPMRQRELLETVPARASAIVCLDLDAILKSSACRSREGRIFLTKDLRRLISLADSSMLPLIEDIALSGNVADLRQVAVIADTMGLIVTAPVREELRIHPQNDNNVKGAPVYASPLLGDIEVTERPDGIGVARSASQIWWFKDCKISLGHAVDYLIGAADQDPISSHASYQAFLARPTPAKTIIRRNVPHNPLGHPFDALCAELRLSNRSLTLNLWALEDGKEVAPLSAMPAVDPAALSEMPPGMIAYAAMGVNDILPLAIHQMSERWPLATRIGVGAVIDVMNTDGGTIAIGAAPGGSAESIRNLNLDSWLVKAVIPVDPEKGYDAAELISFLSAGKLFSRADSLYLEVGGYDLDAYEITSEAYVYGQPKALAYISIPYNHQAMKAFRLRNGYTLDAYATATEASATISIHGPASYILPAAISDAIIVLSR